MYCKVYASYDFEIDILKKAFTSFHHFPIFLQMVGICYFDFFLLHFEDWYLLLEKTSKYVERLRKYLAKK